MNDFLKGIQHLKKDQYLGDIVSTMDLPSFVPEKNYFKSLSKYIIYQQLSIKSARAIYDRFIDLFKNKTINPGNFKKINFIALTKIGISRSKIGYINHISDAFINDKHFLSNIENNSNQEIINQLVIIKGVGPWTCDMFLMFTLNRLDVFPVKDLGIKKGMQNLFKLDKLPDDNLMIKNSNRWKPYRTIACLYLWKIIDGNNIEW